MGEDGAGSLEPGIASGTEFVMSYPNKFLEYYYAANPDELTPGSAPVSAPEPLDAEDDVEEVMEQPPAKKQKKFVEKAPIFNYLTYEKTQLEVGGPKHGMYTHTYRCVAAP